ncbi:MAG: hypothetical protein IBX61_02475 [Thermoleophilia bacterium]|nr:hypothetical protein [Thermoleophilia bacterium]
MGIIIAVMAVTIIDGTAVYYAYKAATEVTKEAAGSARQEYRLHRNEFRSGQVAVDHCEGKGLEFIEVRKLPELSGDAFEVTCGADAETIAFKHLPWLNGLVHQRVSSSDFSST